MKSLPNPMFKPFVSTGVPLGAALGLLLIGASAFRLAAQSFDFNAGNDNGWTRYSLPAIWAATFSFPDDGEGGKAYKIYAPPNAGDPYGLMNARGGSFRADVLYSGRFSVGCDLLSWNAVWRQEAGILYYITDVGLGTTDGYAATYSSGYRNLYITRVLNEGQTTVAELGSGSITFDPTHRYRLVVSTHDGYTFLFQAFDKAEPNNAIASAIGVDYTYNAGVCGLFVFQQTYPSATEAAEATFDNYQAFVPAAGAMPATVTDLSPPPGGKATAVYPTVSVAIMDRDTMVDSTRIYLALDGVWIPQSSLTIEPQVTKSQNPPASGIYFSGATVTYPITTLLPWGSKHTNIVAFADFSNNWHTNTWTWTVAYPYLFASNSLPVGSLNVRGFDVRMAQSDNGGVNLENSLARALQQLAIPPAIPVDRTATSIVQVLNWNKNGTPANVPGLCPGGYINIAVEALTYLELTPGVHRFRINTDDRAAVYSGASFKDPNAVVLWENPGSTANATFEFVVEAAGLYPVRCLWEETGGSALLQLSSVNLGDLSEVLINDPGNPAAVKAFYPMVCQSSSSLPGAFAINPAAVHAVNTVDLLDAACSPTVVGSMVTGGSFTLPLGAETQFYRLDGPRQTRITRITKGASSLVIQYQVQ